LPLGGGGDDRRFRKRERAITRGGSEIRAAGERRWTRESGVAIDARMQSSTEAKAATLMEGSNNSQQAAAFLKGSNNPQQAGAAFLEGLNGPQQAAVQHTDGPLLILAGPGSGKTRVVTRRVAYLAAMVTKPWHILAITFTNKAAKEMQERIAALSVPRGATVCTFHALGAKLLRQHSDRAGVSRSFTIVDRDDRRKLIKQAIEAAELSTTNYAPAAMEYAIGQAKNDMLTPTELALRAMDWRSKAVARVYERYEKILEQQSFLDFDDLLLRLARLLDADGELREQLEERFRYVLIDEYQDTNGSQYSIARLLTGRSKNLCVTGDPDQSIYGWRGANIENILSFERDYPGARVVRLEQNYRSTKKILSAADGLIAGNTKRKAKSLWTENEEGPAVRVLEHEDADEESRSIAREIKDLIREGESPSEIAVFYRVNSLSRVVEEAFLREGVGYQVARGVEFYNRKEVKDSLAYLRVLVNPADELSLKRIINTPPRGIGDTTVERLEAMAQSSGRRLLDTIAETGAGEGDGPASLGRSAGKVREFAELIRSLGAVLTMPPSEALKQVISRSGLRAHYKKEEDGEDSPSANLDELISAGAAFEADHPEATIIEWLEHAALVSDVDAVAGEGGPVTLMTLHAAKGLEFNAVFMLGLEDGLLPFRRREEGTVDEEEERRLCFVGMTRAKRRLTLSLAKYRMMRGITERTVRSPFLDELRKHGVDCPGGKRSVNTATSPASAARSSIAVARERLPADAEKWEVGTLVRHPAHGLGRVVSLERGARRTHVDVMFKSGERRAWILEFAPLVRVEFDEVE